MRGRIVPLSPPRRFVNELLELSRAAPSVPVERTMPLGELVAAREACSPRPCWPALFLRAYGRVCDEMPVLRRAYVKFPWPHVVEYPAVTASVAVERDYAGEPAVFFGRIGRPGELALADLHRRVRGLAEEPIGDIKSFRQIIRVGRLPWPLRRGLLWFGLNLARQRPNRFGTFSLTVYSSLGAESLHPIGPLTTTLTYGVMRTDGSLPVRIVYDHRVLDGATVARALARLEAELTGPVLAELRGPGPALSRPGGATRRGIIVQRAR